MPAYEYRCQDCRKRFDVFMPYSEYASRQVLCKHCGSQNVQRRIGRIRIVRSDDSRLENLADPGSLEGLEGDPKALGRMMRKMSSEVGEEMGPEFDEVIGRLESGQAPEEIERDMPELAADDGGGLPGGGYGDLDDD